MSELLVGIRRGIRNGLTLERRRESSERRVAVHIRYLLLVRREGSLACVQQTHVSRRENGKVGV